MSLFKRSSPRLRESLDRQLFVSSVECDLCLVVCRGTDAEHSLALIKNRTWLFLVSHDPWGHSWR